MLPGCCEAETFKQTWHEIIICASLVTLQLTLLLTFKSTKTTASKKDDLLKTICHLRGELYINTVNK